MVDRTTAKSNLLTHSALLLLGAAGVALIYVSTAKYGMGITSVSCDYISAARNVMDGKGFLLHDGTPYLDYPPLLPILLSVMGFAGLDPLVSIRFLNAFSFGVLIFLSGLWLQRYIRFRPFILLGASAVLFSFITLSTSIYAWPETMFSLLVVLFLLELQKLLEKGGRGSLVGTAVLAGFAILLRYIGVTLILTAIVCIWRGQKGDYRNKARNTLIFLFISVAPMILWLIRNYAVSGTLAGERGPSPFPFIDNLTKLLSIIAGWLFTQRVGETPRIVLLGMLALGLVLMFILQRRKRYRLESTGVGFHAVMPIVVFIVIYCSAMIILSSTVALDRMNGRFLVPVFAPLVWLVVSGVENLRLIFPSRIPKKFVNTILTLVFIIWIAYWGRIETQWVIQYYHHGAGGLSTEGWRNSEIVDYLKNTPIAGTIYTNEPWALYMLAGMSTHQAPRKHLFHSPASTTNDLDHFRDTVSETKNVYLIWINRLDRPYLYTLEELGTDFRLESLQEFSDGTIYTVR